MADERDQKHKTEQQVSEQPEDQPETKSTINWHYMAVGIGSLIGLIMAARDYGFSRSSLMNWRNFGIGIAGLFVVVLIVRWLWRKLVKWVGEQSEAEDMVTEQVVKQEKITTVQPSDSPKVLVDKQQPVIDKSAVNWCYRKF